MPARWWTKLLSLAPVKGVSNQRDEHLQAIEEFANQMVRLKEQAHEEEKRILERTLEDKVKEWRTLASRSVDLLGKGADTFDIAVAEIGQ
jgi:hypothetical protein